LNDSFAFRQPLAQDDNAKPSGQKYIVRFQSRKEYLAFVTESRPDPADAAPFGRFQPIPIINAVSCSRESAARIGRRRGVLDIEEDRRIRIHTPRISPLDSGGLRTIPPSSLPWGVRQIGAPQAWKYTAGKNVKIGVIDTGADFNHPDLRSSLARGFHVMQPHTLPMDDNGHGTHIAGIIAASGEKGMMGVAPQATIYPVKAFDQTGTAYVSDIIYGIDWCTRKQLDIINMSFGMNSRSQALYDAIRAAYRAGLIIVTSSGNDGKKENIDYPARFLCTISVGATRKNRRIASFSNRGKGIDIYAPGDKILSAWPGKSYRVLSGTSMATSHVTGVIALALSLNRRLKQKIIKSLIKNTALPLKGKAGLSAREINAERLIKHCLT
jgi:subtilisin family serine protease